MTEKKCMLWGGQLNLVMSHSMSRLLSAFWEFDVWRNDTAGPTEENHESLWICGWINNITVL